jgi:hypothetical protein
MKTDQQAAWLSFIQRGLLAVLPILLLTVLTAPALSAPITFNTALPVASGEGISRTQFKYLTASDNGPGQLKLPTDMAVDNDGYVYVVDFGHERIQKFAPSE